MTGIRIGAPGSIARHVQETLERDPCHFGANRWLVYEYVQNRPVLRAAQTDRRGAERYLKPDRVLVDVESYRTGIVAACGRR